MKDDHAFGLDFLLFYKYIGSMPTIFYPCPSLSGLLVKPRSPTLLHAMDFPDENPNHYHSYFREGFDPPATDFQVSDYLVLDDGFVEDDSSSQSMASPEQVPGGSSTGYSGATSRNNGMQVIITMPPLDYSITTASSLISYLLKK